jgi:hypothetical protein
MCTSDAPIELHRLRIRERLSTKILQPWFSIHCMTLHNLIFLNFSHAFQFFRGHRPPRSTSTASCSDRLCVSAFRLVTVGGCAFDVAGALVRNSLPLLRHRIDTFVFKRSFSHLNVDISQYFCRPSTSSSSGPCVLF